MKNDLLENFDFIIEKNQIKTITDIIDDAVLEIKEKSNNVIHTKRNINKTSLYTKVALLVCTEANFIHSVELISVTIKHNSYEITFNGNTTNYLSHDFYRIPREIKSCLGSSKTKNILRYTYNVASL